MKFLKKFVFTKSLIIQILISLSCFLVYSFFNYEIIDPENFSWFLKSTVTNDIQTHWISWEFFRNTGVLQFPLFANPQYGEGLNLSIFHTDSIPLAAIFFRSVSEFLAVDFQYFGIWILLSFFLMIYFSTKLINLFVKNNKLSLLFSIFFAISPLFISRIFFQQAVGSHWVIVAALYLYYKDNSSYLKWNILLIGSLLINGYLAAMVLCIFIASVFKGYSTKNNYNLNHIYNFVFTLVLLILSAYLFGLFSIGKGIKEGGFDIYGASLLAFFNPLSPIGFQIGSDAISTYSIVANAILDPFVDFASWRGEMKEVEGFSFLGISIVIFLILILINLKKASNFFKQRQGHMPILILAILLFLYSLSSNIYLGSTKIIEYTVPGIFEPLAEVFRASGRFNWVLYYLIIFFTLTRLSECLRPKILYITLPFFLLFQIIDSSKIIKINQNELRSIPMYKEFDGGLDKIKLKDPMWQSLKFEYNKIRMYPIKNKPRDYIKLAYFASTNKMSTNFGYFSRVNHTTEDILNRELLEELQDNTLSKETIYIINDDIIWELVKKNKTEKNLVGIFDGFRVLAPKP